jgi:hypothetical protein
LKTAERGTNLVYTPEITLHDSSKNSFVRLCEVDSLKSMMDNRPYRLLFREPFILDINLTAFDAKDQRWTYRNFGITVDLSINISMADVWKWHKTGKLNSALTFFGALGKSTLAQFLILEKALWDPDEQHWERVGRLDLLIARTDVSDCLLASEAVQKLPVKRWVDLASIT